MTQWQDISTAPKDGTEILGWREDADIMLIRWTSCDAFCTDRELEGMDEDTAAQEDWFYADFVQGGRLEGDMVPSKWCAIPPPPTEGKPE